MIRNALLLLACLLSSLPRSSEASSSPQEQAAFLAGLPVVSSSPLADLQNSAAYESHCEQLAEKWDYGRKARWEAMRSWARKNLTHKSTRGVVRYLFGGPDFLAAHAFFPKADTLVLGGLEPVGFVADPESLSPPVLAASLAATRQALGTALFAGYFVTREMNAQLRQGSFWGVLPLLYAQMALTGNKILSVEAVRPFGSPGVKISYRRGLRSAQTLYYFQANLSDGPECSRFLAWLGSMGDGASYLKAASYLLHGNGFSQVRQFLLDTSTLIVEDDSGIPYRNFDPVRWKLKVFGEYSPPIFSGYYQDDFRDAYATKANAGPLPFGAGYQVHSDKANILVAARAGRPAPAPQPTVVAKNGASAEFSPPTRKKASPPLPIVAAERRSEPAPPASGTVYLARALPGPSADRAPAAMAPALPASRQSLIVLEAEELRIRRDPALTREERMRKLRDIWQRQLAVMGKTSA
ncbi:MAG: hypothetical protein ACO3YO_06420 [Chthoniobacterales bacterium]